MAYLLTRDWALAEDLLQTALAKAWSAWKRIDTDPEASVSDGDAKGTSSCDVRMTQKTLLAGEYPVEPNPAPVTLRLKLEYAKGAEGERVPIPPDFSLSYGVADNVDWPDYVFPPPPARIPRLASMNVVNTTKLTSDPADPMAPRTVRIRQPRQLGVLIDGTGPTRIHITVDGREIVDFRKWSYDPTPYPLYFEGANPGAVVVVTLTPEYATGPWTAELADGCGTQPCPALSPS